MIFDVCRFVGIKHFIKNLVYYSKNVTGIHLLHDLIHLFVIAVSG